MALTRSFKDTIKARVQTDTSFREYLFCEAVQLMLDGDLETGKSLLRDYINATIGFESLAQATDKKPESLMRMFGANGNPQAKNFFAVILALSKQTGVTISVSGHDNREDHKITRQSAEALY